MSPDKTRRPLRSLSFWKEIGPKIVQRILRYLYTLDYVDVKGLQDNSLRLSDEHHTAEGTSSGSGEGTFTTCC